MEDLFGNFRGFGLQKKPLLLANKVQCLQLDCNLKYAAFGLFFYRKYAKFAVSVSL